jgi:hypothetical protein
MLVETRYVKPVLMTRAIIAIHPYLFTIIRVYLPVHQNSLETIQFAMPAMWHARSVPGELSIIAQLAQMVTHTIQHTTSVTFQSVEII